MFFEICESSSEFRTSTFQSGIRIETVKSCRIDCCKEEISELVLGAVVCRSLLLLGLSRSHSIKLRLILAHFFLHLLPDILLLLPVKSDTASLVLHTICLQERWKPVRDSGQHAFVAILFSRLEHLPLLDHILGITHLSA